MISTIVMVGVGGALGAMARFGVNHGSAQLFGHGFPWATIIVNILGSFFMGIMIAKFSTMDQVSNDMKSLIITGFLGAFTTFSTFSLDFVTMWERGEMIQAFGYMLISVIASITALMFALWLMRGVGIS